MERLERDAILIRLIEALRKEGSWCGETHVQKATYFLQAMVDVPMGFEFILYKHGPFSFDLRDELAAMRADGLIALSVQNPSYGPSIVPDEATATALKNRYPKTLGQHEGSIAFVVKRLRDKPVVDLERLATAYFVSREIERSGDAHARAKRVNELKPHISVEEAFEAIQSVDSWDHEAKSLKQP